MDNKRIQLACVPKHVDKINKLLFESTDERYDFIRGTCFGGMLSIRPQVVRVAATMYMIKFWDRNACRFKLRDGRSLEVTTERVGSIYGLPYGKGKYPITKDMLAKESEVARTFCNELCLFRENKSYISWYKLMNLLQDRNWSQKMSLVAYWRLYCLLCLGSVLIPTQNYRISYRYLRFLPSPEIAAGLCWAGLVQEHLVSKLSSVNMREAQGNVGRPGGNFHCLTHLFYDFIESKSGSHLTCGLPRSLKMQDVQLYFGDGPSNTEDEGGLPTPADTMKKTKKGKGKGSKRTRETQGTEAGDNSKADERVNESIDEGTRLQEQIVEWKKQQDVLAQKIRANEVLIQLEDQLMNLEDQLEDQLEDHLEDQLEDHLEDQLEDQLMDSM